MVAKLKGLVLCMCIRKLKDNTNKVQVVGNLEQKYINIANSNVPSGEVPDTLPLKR